LNKLLAIVLSSVVLSFAHQAMAADDYNAPPAGDRQYASCVVYANKTYEGGDAPSPVRGQNKAQAFCTCMWNETPDDFKGGLAKFSETAKGAATNAICEKHSNWGN
jgi:hypothetical protein